MATYTWLNGGAGIMYNTPGHVLLKKNIDIPDLVTNGGLANTSNVATSLPSTGFADGDILEVFEVPAGTMILGVGVRVSTVEGAASNIDIGVQSATDTHSLAQDIDGWHDALDLNAAATSITAVASGFGPDSLMGQVYVQEGTIDIEFNSDDTETAIFDIWAWGYFGCF